MSKIVLYAPGVHVGGGLILLRELIASSEGRISRYYLDARLRGNLKIPTGSVCQYIAPGVVGRLCGEWRLARSLMKEEILLCFHGLPPLIPQRAKTIVYVQNRNLLQAPCGSSGSMLSDSKSAVKRWLLRALRQNASEYIVQTESMRHVLSGVAGPDSLIRVFPFAGVPSIPADPASSDRVIEYDFVYVGDGEVHKNHKRLIDAWTMLAEEGIRPSLCLTIPERYPQLMELVESACRQHQLKVTNLGNLSHKDVLELYNMASALVFPSLSESLGLPLIEARISGLPVVAAELDYVRDVCEPVETFDPFSAKSIARSIKRFMGLEGSPPDMKSGKEFLEVLAE